MKCNDCKKEVTRDTAEFGISYDVCDPECGCEVFTITVTCSHCMYELYKIDDFGEPEGERITEEYNKAWAELIKE